MFRCCSGGNLLQARVRLEFMFQEAFPADHVGERGQIRDGENGEQDEGNQPARSRGEILVDRLRIPEDSEDAADFAFPEMARERKAAGIHGVNDSFRMSRLI